MIPAIFNRSLSIIKDSAINAAIHIVTQMVTHIAKNIAQQAKSVTDFAVITSGR